MALTLAYDGPMLVGREPEVAAVGRALDQRRVDAGCVLVLAGEPGSSKARLAVEGSTPANARGAGIVWGRCWEAGGAPVLCPWHEAVPAVGIPLPDGCGI